MLYLGPPPRPKPEPIPEPKQAEPEEEAEEEEEEEESEMEYDSDGQEIVKPQKEKKIKKAPTPPPKEPTPPPKEPTPPPKEPTPAPAEPKVEKKKRNWAGDLEATGEISPEAKSPPVAKSKYHLEFLTKMDNRTAAEGTNVKLVFQISGLNPQFIWYRDDEPIEKGRSDIIDKSTETMAALLFPKATTEHSGVYKVVVKNRECRIEGTCNLNVVETIKPREEGIAPNFPFGIKREYFKTLQFLLKH